MKYTKFILSVLAVVLVASLGVVLTSCESSSPPPPTTNGADITIPKVKLFENTSPYAPKLLREVSYERTVNAHKIYVKTTFVASNYIDALRSVDPGIGKAYVDRTDTGDLWGLLLIGIDRVSQSTPKKNIINLHWFKVKTADPNFEFDALIRVCSADGRANTRDGLPVVAENNNFLLEMWNPSSGKDIETNDWWLGVTEKKYQGGPEETNFISGSYTELTNEYGEINRVDANISYDASTGEYVFTIPFTVIPYNDIDKIVVFGAQNPWRGGATIEAVVKPLGSSKTLVYADVNHVVAGIPVVKVPKSSSESPSLIQGSFPDVISSIATSIDAKSGAVTTNISVTLLSVSSNASNMIVFTGPQGSSTVSITNWLYYAGTNNEGDYLYTNAIALSFSAVNDGSDFYAPTNYTVKVVAGNGGNATISVTVEPTISVDRSAILLTSDSDQYTINVSVADGYSTPTSAIASNVNSGATYTVTLTSGSGSFTLGGPSSTANLKGNGGDSVVVFYDDTTSGKRIATSIKIVSGWSVAGYGEYSFWDAKIDMVAYKTNSDSLEILVTFNPIGGGNNLYLAIDVTNRTLGIDASTNTHDSSGDLTIGWGSFWMTNEAGIDYDFVAWGWRGDDGSGKPAYYFNYSGAHRIESDGSFTDVKNSVTVLNTNLVTANDYYFNIPFSAMGATNGNVVNIYVFFGKTGEEEAGKGGIRSIFPAGASVTAPGTWGNYVTRLINKSTNIVLP